MPKKWNQDAKPAEKLLALYSLLLFTGRTMSLTQLSEELDCSKQAVLRLLTQLEASPFGKLVREKQGRESIYSIHRPQTLPKISLAPEGLAHLALCRDFLLHLLPTSVQSIMEETLQHASAYVADDGTTSQAAGGKSGGKSFTKGYINYTPFQESIQTILKAIHQQKVCIIQYKSGLQADVKTYEIAPKLLATRRDALYIHAWVVTERGTPVLRHDSPTIFAVHRLQDIVLTRRNTGHLPEVKEEHNTFGFMMDSDAEPFSVSIAFAPSAATYVAERHWSEEQNIAVHEDGSLTLTMLANSHLEVVSWVLSFGANAEVLDPAWLRDEVAQEVANLATKYT